LLTRLESFSHRNIGFAERYPCFVSFFAAKERKNGFKAFRSFFQARLLRGSCADLVSPKGITFAEDFGELLISSLRRSLCDNAFGF
jgi:hypothetical protein